MPRSSRKPPAQEEGSGDERCAEPLSLTLTAPSLCDVDISLYSVMGEAPSGVGDGTTACEFQNYIVQPQQNVADWSDSAEAWQYLEANWEDVGSPTSTTERTEKPCQMDDGPDTVQRSDTEYRDGPCTLVGPQPMFIYYRQRRTVTNHYYRPHVWSPTQEQWIDGTPESHALQHGLRRLEQYRFAAGLSAQKRRRRRRRPHCGQVHPRPGTHVQIELTVPAEASVSLSWRERDDGPSAAVLTMAGEGELVVEPDSPLRTTRQADPRGGGGDVLS